MEAEERIVEEMEALSPSLLLIRRLIYEMNYVREKP